MAYELLLIADREVDQANELKHLKRTRQRWHYTTRMEMDERGHTAAVLDKKVRREKGRRWPL